MIDLIRRVFLPIGTQRKREADALIHALRNETQVAENERWLLQRERERHERTGHFWRDALIGAPRGDHAPHD
jgi:hypothetical protein